MTSILPKPTKPTKSTKPKQYTPRCKLCGEPYELGRMKIGFAVCLDCGDEIAKERKFTIAPLNKSNYVCITDLTMLKQLNPKRTT